MSSDEITIREPIASACAGNPVCLHCHSCGTEWRVGFTPCTLDALGRMLAYPRCPMCGAKGSDDGSPIRYGHACRAAIDAGELRLLDALARMAADT